MKRRAWLRAPVIGMLVALVVLATAALASADVRTDRFDYSPGDTVAITGDGMQAGETVAVDVSFPDGSGAQHHEVLADDAGNFADSYVLPDDAPGGIFGVTATGESSGAVFTTSFDPLGNGALNCPTLAIHNPTHYKLPVGTTVTCTIDGASEVSGQSTTPVIIQSSALGNTTVTGSVSGTGSSTQITFQFTAPRNGCDTTVVSYKDTGLHANNSVITAGGHATAGLAYVDGSGDVISCEEAAGIDVEKVADATPVSPNDTIGFLITVTSMGPATAHDVELSDPLPTTPGTSWSVDSGTGAGFCNINLGTLECSFGDMAGGASYTVHITSPTTAASMGDITNTAYVTTSNAGDDQDSDTIHVFCPDVRITVRPDLTPVTHGGQIGFKLTLTGLHQGVNYGVTLASKLPKGHVWVLDPTSSPGCTLSSGILSCSFGNIGTNEKRIVHVTAGTRKVETVTAKGVVNGANMMAPVKAQGTVSVV